MAKNVLPVDFQDDILTEDMDGRRRYQMITNADGTVSFVDVTEYTQVGSNFGQAQINATNEAVNESADKNKIIDSKEDLLANTQAGMMAGALAVKEIRSELNEKMQNISFGFSTNTIKTISSRTETYTAVQDCWCVGRIKGGSADPCGIILDDVLLFNLDATSYVPVVIPIKKGQKISIKGNATLCSLNFYESL